MSGGGANSLRQNAAGEGWLRITYPTSAERRRQLRNISTKPERFSFLLCRVKYGAGQEETSACFGGANLPLPRTCRGPPISRGLNFFTASGGDEGGFYGFFKKTKMLRILRVLCSRAQTNEGSDLIPGNSPTPLIQVIFQKTAFDLAAKKRDFPFGF